MASGRRLLRVAAHGGANASLNTVLRLVAKVDDCTTGLTRSTAGQHIPAQVQMRSLGSVITPDVYVRTNPQCRHEMVAGTKKPAPSVRPGEDSPGMTAVCPSCPRPGVPTTGSRSRDAAGLRTGRVTLGPAAGGSSPPKPRKCNSRRPRPCAVRASRPGNIWPIVLASLRAGVEIQANSGGVCESAKYLWTGQKALSTQVRTSENPSYEFVVRLCFWALTGGLAFRYGIRRLLAAGPPRPIGKEVQRHDQRIVSRRSVRRDAGIRPRPERGV